MRLALAFLTLVLAIHSTRAADSISGQGDFRYRHVPGWGEEALARVSVNNGHSIAVDSTGRILFLTDDPQNNVIILDPEGHLLNTWTARMPGAHGMALIEEGGGEHLFITDTKLNEVRKFTLDGTETLHLPWPEASGLYAKASEYRPSKVVPLPDGDLLVFDGYGKDYIHRYDAEGHYLTSWGGDLGEGENQLTHWGPHGGALDLRAAPPILIVCMSDQQEVKRFSTEGVFIDKFAMPGGNPRDAVLFGDHLFIPHLGDNWPADKNAPGFISVLDASHRIVSNIGAPPAQYDADGQLQPMTSDGAPFIHPHGIALDKEGHLYVAQFASPSAPLLKFERLP